MHLNFALLLIYMNWERVYIYIYVYDLERSHKYDKKKAYFIKIKIPYQIEK
jgi:hypothetical protein